MKKEAEQLMAFAKANPTEFFQKTGMNARQWAEEYLLGELQREAMSPEQKKAFENEERLRKYEASEKSQKETALKEQEARMTSEQRERYDKIFVQALAARVIDLRSHLIPNAEAEVRARALRLADQVMTTMALDPSSVGRFATKGYTVVAERHPFVDNSWGSREQTVSRLLYRGTPVHPLPRSAPADIGLQPTTPAADIEAACAFICDVAVQRLVLTQNLPRPEDASITALIKRAIGTGNSLAYGGATLQVRNVEVIDRGRHDTNADVLFRIADRNPAVPASLAVPSALEWPDGGAALISTLQEGDPAVALYGAAAAAADVGQSFCVDRTYNAAALSETVREAAAIVRVVLESEMSCYAAARELLARSPADSGAEAAAALDRRVPIVDSDTSIDDVVAAIDLIREELVPAADRAAVLEGPRVVDALRKLMVASSEVYSRASELGYRIENFPVPYTIRSGTKLDDFLCLTLNGAPLQTPPSTHRDFPDSQLFRLGPWPEIDSDTARQILRDAGDFRAIAKARQAPNHGGLA